MNYKKFKKEAMNYRQPCLGVILILALSLVVIASNVQAKDSKSSVKADKTGTNPINFTHDLRIYNEYLFLNTVGDGYKNIITFEYRTPVAGGKLQFRARASAALIEADLNNDEIDDVDDGASIGDFDFRFLMVPIINMNKKFALAVGLETFLPTATDVSLGSGAFSFGPQVFAVFFVPFGMKGTLVAPSYQQKFSIDEDDGRSEVNQGIIDIFLLWV